MAEEEFVLVFGDADPIGGGIDLEGEEFMGGLGSPPGGGGECVGLGAVGGDAGGFAIDAARRASINASHSTGVSVAAYHSAPSRPVMIWPALWVGFSEMEILQSFRRMAICRSGFSIATGRRDIKANIVQAAAMTMAAAPVARSQRGSRRRRGGALIGRLPRFGPYSIARLTIPPVGRMRLPDSPGAAEAQSS